MGSYPLMLEDPHLICATPSHDSLYEDQKIKKLFLPYWQGLSFTNTRACFFRIPEYPEDQVRHQTLGTV